MRANFMLYNDQQYHILSGEGVSVRPLRRILLCARENLIPLGHYMDWEEDELPPPAWVCIDCKCMQTMRELAE